MSFKKICKNVCDGLEAGQVSLFLSHGREVCTCRDREEAGLERLEMDRTVERIYFQSE